MQISMTRDIMISRVSCRSFAVAACVAAIALGAFVRMPLPFTPVPVTLQTFFVLLTGAFLGKRAGAFSVTTYLALGAAGVPVFTGATGGFQYLLGPTAGYLVGFIPAVLLVAWGLRADSVGIRKILAVFTAASAVILVCGAVWLKVLLGVSAQQAFILGVGPFIPGEIAKIAMAALVYRSAAGRIRQAVGS